MTVLLRIGCGLLAYSPPFAVLFILLSKRPQLVIIALSGAFFWLCSILITSLLWSIVKVSGNNVWPFVIIASVLFQESCRYLCVLGYRKTEIMIKQSSPHSSEVFPLNDLSSSLASGIGFGTMHSLLMYGSVLVASNGTGVLFEDSCPMMPLIVMSAFNSLAFLILDIVLMILAFISDRNKSYLLWVIIVAIHLVASMITLANKSHYGCEISLTLLLILVVSSLGFLYWISPLMTRKLVANNAL